MSGIYIHIPFCKQRCTYCDFHFSTSFHAYREEMIKAISGEIELRKDYLPSSLSKSVNDGFELNSIYFGGGTPSLLEADELKAILDQIRSNFAISNHIELTLEANPDDISAEKLKFWKELGINRLSIGLQSFKEEDLQWMNRAHNVKEALNCIPLAQSEGFDNLTVDLIYGLPNLSLKEWKKHIETVLELGVNHISAYCLTVEEKTALNSWVRSGKIKAAGENEQSEQFLLLIETLEKNGFEQYEISNFAKPGHHAVHNSNYWKGEHYLGIGPSAHSFNGTSRSWNIRNNQLYIKEITQNGNWIETEILSTADRFNELLLTGLRTKWGVSLLKLLEIIPEPKDFYIQLEEFIGNGLVTKNDQSLILTPKGRLQADRIAADLFQI